MNVWFWQIMISPHMAHLAAEMVNLGCKVTYVAQVPMSQDRASQGWRPPELPGVEIHCVSSRSQIKNLVFDAAADSIHICQGLRANGVVGVAQEELAGRGLRQWVVMETVNDAGSLGLIKRMVYRHILKRKAHHLEGILATGHKTKKWLSLRGYKADRTFPFAYFLPPPRLRSELDASRAGPFRFVYVGRLIELKRVDHLIRALARLHDRQFELVVVGAGPEEQRLRRLGVQLLPNRIRWIGQLPIERVPDMIGTADCLVLPSRHDGWGAVISESLMVGTPVICSDACGAAEVVQLSGAGSTFRANDVSGLYLALMEQLKAGKQNITAREDLAAWARCLSSVAGAEYLRNILAGMATSHGPLSAPWHKPSSHSVNPWINQPGPAPVGEET